jgi:hypothetical protein
MSGQNDAYYGRTPAAPSQFDSNAAWQNYQNAHAAETARQEQARQQSEKK